MGKDKENNVGLPEQYDEETASRASITLEHSDSSVLIIPPKADKKSSDWKYPTHFLEEQKRKPQELKKLNRKLGKFYKHQNKLIESFISLDELHGSSMNEDDKKKKKPCLTRDQIAIYLSFMVNILLFGIKIYAFVASGSISVIASALDSALDLLSGSILFVTAILMRKKNPYKYPAGKARMEPLGIIVFSSCMFTAAIQVLIEAITTLVNQDKEGNKLDVVSISIIGATIVLKLCLFIFCKTVKNSGSVEALAEDHRNDIVSNSFGLATAAIGRYVLWYIDPIGGIVMSLYIMQNWFRTGLRHVKKLSGRSASPKFLAQITYLAFNHDPRIKKIDTVRAFHLGMGYLVEVDVILPEAMSLKEAHDIGEALQMKIERLNVVERAFVHLDHEGDHAPEHAHDEDNKVEIDHVE